MKNLYWTYLKINSELELQVPTLDMYRYCYPALFDKCFKYRKKGGFFEQVWNYQFLIYFESITKCRYHMNNVLMVFDMLWQMIYFVMQMIINDEKILFFNFENNHIQG